MANRPKAGPGTAHVPRQRSRPRTVLVLLTVEEPMTALVRFGSQAAEDRGIPLEIAMLAPGGARTAECMAAMDASVQEARATAPEVEIRVETNALDPDHLAGLREGRHPVVVASRETRDAYFDGSDLRWVKSRRLVVL